MVLRTEKKADVIVFYCPERIDVLSFSDFVNAVNQLKEKNINKIILEMSRTHSIDSAGFSVIVKCLKQCKENDGALKIVQPQSRVIEMLNLTGLASVVRIHENIDSALEDLK